MRRSPSIRSFPLWTVLLMVIAPAYAQAPDAAQMQRLMEGMQAMQQCLGKIDQKTLQQLEKRGEKMESEIGSLCAAGKRDEAQRRAIAFSVEIMNDPAAKQMNACAKQARQLMPSMASTPFAHADDDTAKHVCDERD